MLRADFEIIQQWIKTNSQVLDLGCGDGVLLSYLQDRKNVFGYGLEIDADNINAAITAGVNVIEQDLDKGLANFSTDSFDVVIMTQALQAVHYPDKIIDDMLRVGKEAILTFPNFGHWRCRWYLLSKGRMPISKMLPYTWYNTPNIHLCTFKDFEALCHRKNIKILERLVVDQDHKGSHWMNIFPNWLGETAIYRITRTL